MTTHRRTRPCCSVGLASVPPGAAGCKTPPSGPRGADLRRIDQRRCNSPRYRLPQSMSVVRHRRHRAYPALTLALTPAFSIGTDLGTGPCAAVEACGHGAARTVCRHAAELPSDADLIDAVGDTGERRRACRGKLASSTSNGWSRALASGGDRFVPRAGRLAQPCAAIHPDARRVYPGKQGVR
jgi:hypothetical protein